MLFDPLPIILQPPSAAARSSSARLLSYSVHALLPIPLDSTLSFLGLSSRAQASFQLLFPRF